MSGFESYWVGAEEGKMQIQVEDQKTEEKKLDKKSYIVVDMAEDTFSCRLSDMADATPQLTDLCTGSRSTYEFNSVDWVDDTV